MVGAEAEAEAEAEVAGAADMLAGVVFSSLFFSFQTVVSILSLPPQFGDSLICWTFPPLLFTIPFLMAFERRTAPVTLRPI